MKRVLCLCAVLLGGCVSTRGSEPKASWMAAGDLNASAACVVAALDGVDTSLTHHVQTIVPGQVVEVAPQQTITVGNELYYARLTREPHGTRIALHSIATWAPERVAAVSRCGSPAV